MCLCVHACVRVCVMNVCCVYAMQTQTQIISDSYHASNPPYICIWPIYNEDKENNEWTDGVCLCVATHMCQMCVCVPDVQLLDNYSILQSSN